MAEPGPQPQDVPAPNPPPPTADPAMLQAPQQQGQQIVHLNWSHVKPEFLGKPDEDAKAHPLHTNDWMTTHHFVEGVNIQRFRLTQLGEARSWYHSLEAICVDWQGLQNLFRQ